MQTLKRRKYLMILKLKGGALKKFLLTPGINWGKCARRWKFHFLIDFSRRMKPSIRQISRRKSWSNWGMLIYWIEQRKA
jgi:hypothetical protein